MAEPKVAQEVAEIEVDAMLEALGVSAPDASARAKLVEAAMDGRITFDATREEGEYRLARPVALENGSRLEAVKFREPTGAELQHLNAGMRIDVDATRKTASVDLAQNSQAAIRFAVKIGGVPLGVAERIKARDLAVLGALAGFFQ